LDQFLASYLDKCLKTAIYLKEKNFNQFWFQHGVGWLKHEYKACINSKSFLKGSVRKNI